MPAILVLPSSSQPLNAEYSVFAKREEAHPFEQESYLWGFCFKGRSSVEEFKCRRRIIVLMDRRKDLPMSIYRLFTNHLVMRRSFWASSSNSNNRNIERDPNHQSSIDQLSSRVSISSGGVIGTICHLTGVHQHPIDMQSCISHWTTTATSPPSPVRLVAEEIKERVLIGEMDRLEFLSKFWPRFVCIVWIDSIWFLCFDHATPPFYAPQLPPPLDPSP